jgi:hypothetical protein
MAPPQARRRVDLVGSPARQDGLGGGVIPDPEGVMKNRCVRLSTFAALAGLPLGLSAQGATLAWNNAAGGAASTAANWNPNQIPVAADVLNYGLNASYAVSFSPSVPSVAQHNLNLGTVTFASTAPHSITGQLVVALAAASNATLNITSGTFNSSGIVSIGGNASGTGFLNVSGTGVLNATSANGIRVGNTGNGTLKVLSGGLATCTNMVRIGALAGSQGLVEVLGSGQLNTTNAVTGDVTVGDAGPGTMNMILGGHSNIASDLNVAPNAGVSGTVNVGGSNLGQSAINVAGDLNISSNTTAAAGGTGLVSITNHGSIDVVGTVRVGDANGGTGTLRIDDETNGIEESLHCTSLIFSTTGSGILDLRDGLLEVEGGTFTPPSPNLVLNAFDPSKLPALRLTSIAPTSVASVVVGQANEAQFQVRNSTFTTNSLLIGAAPGGPGSYVSVSGGSGLLQVPGITIVGNGGKGFLNVLSTSTFTGGDVDLAPVAGSVAELEISNSSTMTLSGALDMGNVGSVGTPTIEILSGGVLNVAGNLNMRSSNSVITLNGGTINANRVLMQGTSQIIGTGVINAEIVDLDALPSITATGPLVLGNPGRLNGFQFAGDLSVGSHAVTVRGFDGAHIGDTTIAGGTLDSNSQLMLFNGDSFTGFGTIASDLELRGSSSVVATGTGLVLEGTVTNFAPINVISGTRITLAPSAIFRSRGNVAMEVHALPGSTIVTIGDLSLGIPNTTSSLTLGGATLNVQDFTVTLMRNNGSNVGFANLRGGTLTNHSSSPSTAQLNTTNGSLSGHGTVSVPNFHNHNNGVVSPGLDAAFGVGTLNFTGNYTSGNALNPAGTVNIDLRSPTQFDRLVVAGNASLAGTLNVSLINGYTPLPGVLHPIVTSTGGFVLGDFVVKNLPPRFFVDYSPTAYSIGLACPADIDDGEGGGRPNGGVDVNDLLYFLEAFEAGSLDADLDNGSFTGTPDGGVDISDLLYFLAHFEAGC